MNLKNLAFKGSMVAGAIAVIGGIAILNYDRHDFYQEDLDNAHHRLWLADQNLIAEYEDVFSQSYNEVKSYPEYKQMDSLSRIHKQDPEANWKLERKIDSLYSCVDSIREKIVDRRIENSQEIQDATQRLNNAVQNVVALTQDSIINDSIENQPVGQRFKNNWNKIFCNQKKR